MGYMLDLVIKAPKSTVDSLVQGYVSSDLFRCQNSTVNSMASAGGQSLAATHVLEASSGMVTLLRFWNEFCMLSLRLFRKIWRHPFLIILNFVLNLVAALAVGFFYMDQGYDTPGIQNRAGSLFFILLFLSFMALSSLPVWIVERASHPHGVVLAHHHAHKPLCRFSVHVRGRGHRIAHDREHDRELCRACGASLRGFPGEQHPDPTGRRMAEAPLLHQLCF